MTATDSAVVEDLPPIRVAGFDADVPIASIEEHPENPRVSDDEAIEESIRANGFGGAVRVQQSTRHVVAGNGTLRAMRRIGYETIPVLWLDCDDNTARRLLLADNRAADLGYYNNDALAGLLSTLADSDDLLGTLYSEADVSVLLAMVTDHDPVNPSAGGLGGEPPTEFPSYDETIRTEHACPRCGYEWSGSSAPPPREDDDGDDAEEA